MDPHDDSNEFVTVKRKKSKKAAFKDDSDDNEPIKEENNLKASKSSIPKKTVSKEEHKKKSLEQEVDDIKKQSFSKSESKAKEPNQPSRPISISNYFKMMNREGPQKLGERSIPKGSIDCLLNMTFVISGILEYVERDDAVNMIQRHGGKVTQAVSGKTSYLVVGREPGESKLKKANSLGTKIIDENKLFDMIEKSVKTYDEIDLGEIKIELKHVEKKDRSSNEIISQAKSPRVKKTYPSTCEQKSKDEINISLAGSQPNPKISMSCSTDNSLWVDKYKPRTFKEMVGQNGPKSPANKLLSWLKAYGTDGKDEGSRFKAALLSGPPGIGKTTSAVLCCKELNLNYIELNASDSRNSKYLKGLFSQSTTSNQIDLFFGSQKSTKSHHAIIMDEIDGISGNQDRGGLTEVVNLIKATKVPIICICNDRSNQKIKTLTNYCYDIRFVRPRLEQIKAYCMSIAHKEKLKLQPQALDQWITSSGNDIRQIINHLQMVSTTKSSLDFDEAIKENENSFKDSNLNIFESTRKLFNASDASKMSIQQKTDLFFVDYSTMPLMMHENYILCAPAKSNGKKLDILKFYSQAAESFCISSLVDVAIRSNSSWSLLPVLGLFSTVLVSHYVNGLVYGMINFTQWLGKNSSFGKNNRQIDQLCLHSSHDYYIPRSEMILYDVPYMHYLIYEPLTLLSCIEDGTLDQVVQLVKQKNLTREDWDLFHELNLYPTSKFKTIPTKTKTTFTRLFNKFKKILPYSTDEKFVKTSKRSKTKTIDKDDIIDFDAETYENIDNSSSDSENSNVELKTLSTIVTSKPAQLSTSKPKIVRSQTATSRKRQTNTKS